MRKTRKQKPLTERVSDLVRGVLGEDTVVSLDEDSIRASVAPSRGVTFDQLAELSQRLRTRLIDVEYEGARHYDSCCTDSRCEVVVRGWSVSSRCGAAKDGRCCGCGYEGEAETACAVRSDKSHCRCWWEGPNEPGPEKVTKT